MTGMSKLQHSFCGYHNINVHSSIWSIWQVDNCRYQYAFTTKIILQRCNSHQPCIINGSFRVMDNPITTPKCYALPILLLNRADLSPLAGQLSIVDEHCNHAAVYIFGDVVHAFMPQSHPTAGPVRFLSPVRFLARKAEWSARRNFTSVLFPWSHQATGPVRLDTAAYLWFGWIIRRTPRVPRAMPVWAPHGNLKCFSHPTGPVRGPCVTRNGVVRGPSDTQGYWHNHNWQKSRTGVVFGRTGPVRSPHGLFTGCLWSLNPYGARKLKMHVLKLYGPRTGRQNSYDAVRGPSGPREWTYDFCSKQPGNSPYGAREYDVSEALVKVRSHCRDANRRLTIQFRTDFRFVPSQWETALLCNDVYYWLGAGQKSTLQFCHDRCPLQY